MDSIVDEKGQQVSSAPDDASGELGGLVNTSGHVQELDRNFGFWSICAISIVADDAWAAGGGSLIVAFYDGGAPGVLYEFIVVSIFYFFIGAALAELASAIPSSASVYHWASVTGGPKFGRICSWLAGWWNCLAWIFGTASVSLFGANATLAIYSLYHPDYNPQRWHIFIAYLGVTWIACAIVLFGQRILPRIANLCAGLCIGIWFVTVMVCAIMPSTTGKGYASSKFVWREWNNQTGWSSNGFVFCAGMLNGAFAIGTPDGATHLAEEIPHPKRNIPKGIAAQLIIGFLTTFIFYIALLYAITSLDEVLNSPIIELPLAAIYLQATNSRAGTTGLLVIFLINLLVTIPGAYVTCGRMLWTLARDDATPFSGIVGRISPTHRNPFNATFVCGCCCTILGCIYIGNQTAFNAFVGCFAILTTMSYLAAILPHILFRRKYVKPGPFWMPGAWGYIVTGISSAYIIVFNIIYCFPYAMPVNAASMNYSCLMSGGLTIFVSVWYLWKRDHGYVGPHVLLEANNEATKGIVGIPVTEGREGTSVLRGSMHSAKHSQGVHEANEATMVG